MKEPSAHTGGSPPEYRPSAPHWRRGVSEAIEAKHRMLSAREVGETKMRTFRFYFCDVKGDVVRAQNLACDDDETRVLAGELLASLDPVIVSVEVWERTTLLHRAARNAAPAATLPHRAP